MKVQQKLIDVSHPHIVILGPTVAACGRGGVERGGVRRASERISIPITGRRKKNNLVPEQIGR